MNLEKRLQKGLIWSVIQVLIKRFFDFFVKLVLLNILFPEDFGIISIATAITGIFYIIAEFGLRDALIQRNENKLRDIHYQSVFWWGIFWSCFLYVIIYFFGTPIISDFYEEPILLKIIPILTIPVIINSITLVYRVNLLRNLNFKTIAIINTIATVLSGFIALVVALKGGGVWSLVVYIFLPFLFSWPIYILIAPWSLKLKFSAFHLKDIFKFSVYTFFTALILIISGNIDYLFIGKLISTKSLGIYSLAFMLTILLSRQITSMIDRVMFPFYSKVQKDVKLLKSHYLNSLKYYCLILYPIMLTLIVLCSPIIKTFFDVKWIEAKTPIRILALAVIINLCTHGCNLIYRSMGKPKLEMFIFSFILFFITLPGVYIGSFYGIIGVSFATLVSAIVNFFISLYFLNRELSLSLLDIFKKLKPSVFAFTISFLVVVPLYLFAELHFILLFLILIIVYGFIINYFYKEDIKIILKKLLVYEK